MSNMKPKLYIIHSEYVSNGIIFNPRTKYTTDPEKATRIYEETLAAMKEDNADILKDKENYRSSTYNRGHKRYFTCFYKYQPGVSNFTVDMSVDHLE